MDTLNCKNEIINRALSLLREKEIIDSSIEPSTDTEKLIYKWYEISKAECIMEIEPTFAIKRIKLNRDKIVNADDLSEFKTLNNNVMTFEEWIKDVVQNDIEEIEKIIEQVKTKITETENKITAEEEKQESDQEYIEKLKQEIKHLNIHLFFLKEKILYLCFTYNIENNYIDNIDDIEIIKDIFNNYDENIEETEEDNKELTEEEKNKIESIRRRQRIAFFKMLSTKEQIRKYNEYKAWTDYKNKIDNNKKAVLYSYRIPSDCLKILDKNFEFMEGNYIYSYIDNGLLIRYLSNDVELYNREIKFNLALSYILAYYICADLQNNDNKTQLFFQLKNNKISEARTENLRENGVEIIKNYRWKK